MARAAGDTAGGGVALSPDEEGEAPKVGLPYAATPRPLSERAQWYESVPAAADQPDWRVVEVVGVEQLAPEVRQITLSVEASRELVALKNAYSAVGQLASLKVDGGEEMELAPSTPPFSLTANKDALWKLKFDLYSGEIKEEEEEPTSVTARLDLHVHERAHPAAYNLQPGDGKMVELGPFCGGGLNFRKAVNAVYRFPEVMIFAAGDGVAHARALIEQELLAQPPHSLNLSLRKQARLFYRAANREAHCYQGSFESWRSDCSTEVDQTTMSLPDAFDDGDFAYNPETTCAIVLVEDEEEEEELVEFLIRDAEIAKDAIVTLRLDEQEKMVYLTAGKQV